MTTSSDLPLSPHQPQPIRCGTPAGYRAHRKAGEVPCRLCREANAEYLREYRIRRDLAEDPDGVLRRAEERLREAKAHYDLVRRVIDNPEPEPIVAVQSATVTGVIPDYTAEPELPSFLSH